MGIKHIKVVSKGEKGMAADWNADHEITGNVECNQHQHKEHVIENRTDWPAGPVEGQVIYRSDQHTFYHWNGTIWVSMVGPATVVVAIDGSGNTTDIQEGIDMLPATGGVVYIKEGTYNVPVVITVPEYVGIMGAGYSTLLQRSGTATGLFSVTGDYVMISQLRCLGTGMFDANYNITVTGNNFWIRDVGIGDSTSGLNLSGISRAYVDSVYCDPSASYGSGVTININNSDYTVVTNCYLRGGNGISINGSYNRICNCHIESRVGTVSGIILNSGNHNVIDGNTILDGVYCGIRCHDNNNIISNNAVYDSSSITWGIGNIVITGDNNVIEGNVADTTDTFPNIAISGDNNIITNNRCLNSANEGILIEAAGDRNIVVANQLMGNNVAFTDNGTNTESGHNIVA